LVQKTGSTPGYGFTGREWDPETGLYYYRARYFDPDLGRFISEDPAGHSADSNFFVYVGNNPLNWSDPFGLQKYRSEEEAAVAGLQTYTPQGQYHNREIGFPICQRDDGFYIGPVVRSPYSDTVNPSRTCDRGGKLVAVCHTHSLVGSPGNSDKDEAYADYYDVRSYVGDVFDNISLYDPKEGTQTHIGTTPGEFP